MATPAAPSRRERLRTQTLAEIKQHALAQVAQDGPEAVSLNAIAKSMGMSGPALYRYFTSRDDLLSVLVAEAYGDLAGALERASTSARRRPPEGRFRAVCDAYRQWAIDQPHRYRLALGTRFGSGRFAPEETLPAADRSMVVLLDALAGLGPLPATRPDAIRALDAQLGRWRRRRALRDDVPSVVLELAILTWSRLHGTVSLELVGVFDSMSLDPALLYRAEVDGLLAQHAALGPAAASAHPPEAS